MDLSKSLQVAVSGLDAESARLKVISENLANAQSTALTPGGDPYRRKVISFKSVFDQKLDATKVGIGRVGPAGGELQRHYDPVHPGADAEGYVKMPNVNPMIEVMDMREAQRSYEANLNVIEASKAMLSRTIDLLRG